MRRLSLTLLFLFVTTLPAAAEKQKQIVQFDSVLFVRADGKTNIVLFDNGTAQLLASNVPTPASAVPVFFPTDSVVGVNANEWANDAMRSCPLKGTCIRWQSIGILRTVKKKQPELGLGVGGSFIWIVPVGLAVSDLATVVGLGDTSLKTEKDWREYTDNWGLAQEKATQQQNEAQEQERQKEAEAITARALASLKVTQNRSECLTSLKFGDPASKVYSCGYPDHTNSDLYTDQLVYPNDIFVYIDKRTDTVSNVQWTE